MYYQRKVAIHTLGCKLNFSEGSAIMHSLSEQGFHRVEFSDRADYYIINTCSVTENADRETKRIVRNAKRTNPDAKVIVVGCYAQLKPEEIAQIEGVNLVLGANEKFKIGEHVEALERDVMLEQDVMLSLSKHSQTLRQAQGDNGTGLLQSPPVTRHPSSAKIVSSPIDSVSFYADAFSRSDRTRSFLKVQDGCDYQCSFCTIPLARGNSRSNSIEKTVALARQVAATGVKEIVLTGVNIGDFGKTPDGNERTSENFFQLIQQLEQIEEVQRWRISSIEPNLLTDEIIEFVARSNSFMPHFHIPLQSGSDKILKLMRRKYLRNLYAERVAKIKTVMPHACIGVDVIVGFPGETQEQFMETYNFINALDVSYLHVFTYSERANTRALKIEPIVPIAERKERNKMLRILSEKKKRAFYAAHVGEERSALFEAESDEDIMFGFTDNYIKVALPFDAGLVNTIQPVVLESVSDFGYMRAQLCERVEALQHKTQLLTTIN